MAFRRGFRRKRKRVLWLPNEVPQTEGQPRVNFVNGNINVLAVLGGINTVIHALTVDYPAEAIQAAGPQPPTVADYTRSGYRLERIVGKFHCGMSQLLGDGQVTFFPTSCLLALGFIVLRVDELTGAPLRAATPDQYSPLVDNNERDPFLWRRTWLLANDVGIPLATAVDPLSNGPRANSDYGSTWDGPHIDTSSRRIIRDEERLFAVVSTANTSKVTGSGPCRVDYLLDYRMLVTPAMGGNRRNASR